MNTTLMIKDDNQKKMLESMEDVFADGTLYSLNYTQDYKLEQILQRDIATPVELIMNCCQLMDIGPLPQSLLALVGCSCFMCRDEKGHVLVGRNYDIKHEMTGILMASASQKDAISSMSLVDAGWLGYVKGDLNDGSHDISLTALAPYLPVEGMNKEGLVIAVLQLMAPGVHQDTGKRKQVTTLAIRNVLDKAHNVDEAIKIFESIDMQTSREDFDYHFFLADKSGRSVVVEYFKNQMKVFETDRVTNFYLADPEGILQVGRERYEVINSVLNYKGKTLNSSQVLDVLKLISQPSGCDTGRSNTRWSVVYDLSDLTMKIYTDHRYGGEYVVSLKEEA